MKKLILHIGASKSASSTIQKYLGENFSSKYGTKNQDGDALKYACVAQNGRIWSGSKLRRTLKRRVTGHMRSEVFVNDKRELLTVLRRIEKNFQSNDVILMSCEGWSNQPFTVDIKAAFEEFGVPIDIFFVTRAPVDLMNSAWWQWGAWKDVSIENWIKSRIASVDFYQQHQRWKSISTVNEIKLLDLSQNPLTSLQNFLKVEEKKIDSMNVGTHPALLRHLVANKNLYPRAANRPAVEWQLNNLLNLPQQPPPFVIPQEMSEHIISSTKASNKKLIKLIESSTGSLKAGVLKKYTEESAYHDRKVQDFESFARPTEQDILIKKLIDIALSSNISIREKIRAYLQTSA